jgi:hypothetical protein
MFATSMIFFEQKLSHSVQGIRNATSTANSLDFCQFVDRSSVYRDSLHTTFDTVLNRSNVYVCGMFIYG